MFSKRELVLFQLVSAAAMVYTKSGGKVERTPCERPECVTCNLVRAVVAFLKAGSSDVSLN